MDTIYYDHRLELKQGESLMNQEIRHVEKLNSINPPQVRKSDQIPLTEFNIKVFEGPARRTFGWIVAGAIGGWIAVSLLSGAKKSVQKRFQS